MPRMPASILGEYGDIFAARDEDYRRTGLVQHAIDTGSARPIRLRPNRLALAQRQAAEGKVREMAAGGVIEPSSMGGSGRPGLEEGW